MQTQTARMSPRTPLTLGQLKERAPSVFATHAASRMSQSYAFVSSLQAMDIMAKVGLVPVDASQRRAKNDPSVARHLVRLAFKEDLEKAKARKVGDTMPEVILVNSHNGRTAFKLYYGLFRFVCSNGLIVSDHEVGATRRHIGSAEAILEEVDNILEQGDSVIKRVHRMKQTTLTDAQRLRFAQRALELRYAPKDREDEEKENLKTLSTILPEQLLVPRRPEDKGLDLWHTYNVVQENMVVGGLTGKSSNGRATHTRQLRDVRKLVSVNTGLWDLASSLIRVKEAA